MRNGTVDYERISRDDVGEDLFIGGDGSCTVDEMLEMFEWRVQEMLDDFGVPEELWAVTPLTPYMLGFRSRRIAAERMSPAERQAAISAFFTARAARIAAMRGRDGDEKGILTAGHNGGRVSPGAAAAEKKKESEKENHTP